MRYFVFMLCALGVTGRLQSFVKPLSYELTLNLTRGLSYESYQGELSIAFNVTTALHNRTFSLHSSGIDIQSSSLQFKFPYGFWSVSHKIRLNSSEELLTVEAQTTIDIGQYILKLEFMRTFDGELQGFYRSSYTADGSVRWFASTQFESSAARRAFPCFDEPKWRAPLRLQFYLPSGLHAASNMPQLSTTNFQNVTKLVQFAETPAMPTYLYAWYVGDSTFGELTTTTVNGVRYGLHGRRSLQGEVDFSSEYAPQIIQKLENFTGVSYSATGMKKMDQVGIPEFNAGAMENWGFVGYRESYLFVNNRSTTESEKEKTLMVIAHEFAHQWFGNMVTLEWWSYTWLNEAFARYMQYVVAGQLEPSWKLNHQFLINVKLGSMVSDLEGSHPLTDHNVSSISQIENMFDDITYNKGASLLWMFSTELGENTFRKWLKTYLERVIQSGGVASPDDFWESNQTNFSSIPKRRWTEVSGHPIVRITRNNSNRSYVISQMREALDGSEHLTGLLFPIKVVSRGVNVSVDRYFLLESNETETVNMAENTSNPEWYYLVNEDTSGYYRVLYDKDNWMALKAAIGRSEISSLLRAQLVSDALNLAQNGYLSPKVAFDFSTFLSSEQDFLVWSAAMKAFQGIDSFLHGFEQPKSALEAYVSDLMNSATELIRPMDNPSHYDKVLMSDLADFLCTYRTSMCAHLLDILSSTDETYDVELSGARFCVTVQTTPTFWDILFTMYRNADSPTQKRRYLSSLACTTNSTNQRILLERLLDPAIIKKQEFNSVLSSMSTRINGFDSIVRFFKSKSTQIVEHLSGNKLKVKAALSTLAKRLYNPDMMKTLEDLLEQTPAFGLSKEEKQDIIAVGQRRYRGQKLVAERICEGFGLTCQDKSAAQMSLPTIVPLLVIILTILT